MWEGGWHRYIFFDEQQDRPEISRAALRRVAAYGWPYRWHIALMLVSILAITLLGLAPPLLVRQLSASMGTKRFCASVAMRVSWSAG